MQNNLIEKVQKTFEEIKLEDETGFEFWSARDLMKSLWYKKWERFGLVIKKAKLNCLNSSTKPENHFVPSDKMVELDSWSKRKIKDFLLTRYACYLVAQNWDSRKVEVSLAQTYFASQTRKLEMAEKEIEDTKRLEARDEVPLEGRSLENQKGKLKKLFIIDE